MLKKELPLITIVIPSYNHEQYIEECLNKVIKINILKKIIIIDDGSTDETAVKIHNFILNNKIENIEFIQKENSGLVSSLNLGLSKADTDFLYFIASDDIPNPRGIKQAIEYLIENPNIEFFIGGGENFFEDGRRTKIYTNKHTNFFSLNFEARAKQIFLDYPSPLLLQSTIFRTDILKKIGGWDRSIILDDYPMFVKLLTNKNIQFIFNPSIETVNYRIHSNNSAKNLYRQFSIVKQAIEQLAPVSIVSQAIGYKLGYYILVAISRLNFKMIFSLMATSKFRYFGWMSIAILRLMTFKLMNFFKNTFKLS